MQRLYSSLTSTVCDTVELHTVWDTYLPYLIRVGLDSNSKVFLEPVVAIKYRFNFKGLMVQELKITNGYYHYPTMRLNGYHSSDEYKGIKTDFLIFNPGIIASFLELVKSDAKTLKLKKTEVLGRLCIQ